MSNFIEDAVRHARRYDPQTSKDAAVGTSAKKYWTNRVRKYIIRSGAYGATTTEMFAHFSKLHMEKTGKTLSSSSISGRANDLVIAGKVRYSGTTRVNPDTNRSSRVLLANKPPFIPMEEKNMDPLVRANLRYKRQLAAVQERFTEKIVALKEQLQEARRISDAWEHKARTRLAKLKKISGLS